MLTSFRRYRKIRRVTLSMRRAQGWKTMGQIEGRTPNRCFTLTSGRGQLIVTECSLAVLHPRVGHTMDVLSRFISVLCHSDWLFHGESCPRIDVVHPGRAWSSSPTCTWHCFLNYLFHQTTPLFPHGVTIVCKLPCFDSAWQFPLYSSFVKNPLICFLCCPRNPQNLSQPFHLKGVKTCFFILTECPAFTAVRCYRPH